jgi:hypothetical protein
LYHLIYHIVSEWKQVRSVGTVTRLQNDGAILDRVLQSASGTGPAYYSMGSWGSRVKLPRLEADYSTESRIEVKDERSYTPTSHTPL